MRRRSELTGNTDTCPFQPATGMRQEMLLDCDGPTDPRCLVPGSRRAAVGDWLRNSSGGAELYRDLNLCQDRVITRKELVPWGLLDEDHLNRCGGSSDRASYSTMGLVVALPGERVIADAAVGGIHPATVTRCRDCVQWAGQAVDGHFYLKVVLAPADGASLPGMQLTPLDMTFNMHLFPTPYNDICDQQVEQHRRAMQVSPQWANVLVHDRVPSPLRPSIDFALRLHASAGEPDQLKQASFIFPHSRVGSQSGNAR
eukprot:jgi/Tetstr1/459876/TSEL_005218.t1